MGRLASSCLLLLAACTSPVHDDAHATPERAVRGFVEAGRAGDHEAARAMLVSDERRPDLRFDCRDLGDYRLAPSRRLDERSAVVTLCCGDVRTPLVAVREPDGWYVSMRESLAQMQAPGRNPLASAPR